MNESASTSHGCLLRITRAVPHILSRRRQLEGKDILGMKTPLAALVLLTLPFSSSALTEFETVLNSYGKLRTAAGRGLIRSKGVNGWALAMEGGNAVDAELSRPHMTMADQVGNLYIADKDAHAIRKVTPYGTIYTIAGTGEAGFNDDGIGIESQLDQPNGLYTLPDGTTYILDLGNSRIRKLSTAGDLTTIVHDPDGIVLGRGLWVSDDETLIYYACGNAVKKWAEAEGLTTYADGFTDLGNIDVDPLFWSLPVGNLVVTDRGANRVYRIFPDGSKQAIAGNGQTTGGGDGEKALETGLHGVRGICFAPNGGYYLATHEGGQVWYVDVNGYIHLLIDGDTSHTHAGDGEDIKTPGRKISEPRAVTLAPNGDLIVTENDYGYVRVVERVFVILDTTLDEVEGFTLTWSCVPEMNYKIEFKDDLSETTWQHLGDVPARGADIVTFFTDPAAAAKVKGFYRVAPVE